MIPPCAYRDFADEASRTDTLTRTTTRAEVFLCSWPSTLTKRPPWMARLLGVGLAIDPERDCAGCQVALTGQEPSP